MNKNKKTASIPNTENLDPRLVEDLVLVPCTRAEIEEARTDANRFQVPEDYQTEEDLKWLRTEENRKKFIELYFNK